MGSWDMDSVSRAPGDGEADDKGHWNWAASGRGSWDSRAVSRGSVKWAVNTQKAITREPEYWEAVNRGPGG